MGPRRSAEASGQLTVLQSQLQLGVGIASPPAQGCCLHISLQKADDCGACELPKGGCLKPDGILVICKLNKGEAASPLLSTGYLLSAGHSCVRVAEERCGPEARVFLGSEYSFPWCPGCGELP